MGMRYSSQFNLDKLRQNLFAKQGRAYKGMREGCEEAAELIMQKSMDNSPVDTYNLEEAHHLEKHETDAGNIKITIEVSGVGHGSDNPRDVETYAMLVHELMSPYGAGELNGKPFHIKNSPQNNAKIAEGKAIGGKFMERAIESERAKAIAIIRASVKRNMFK